MNKYYYICAIKITLFMMKYLYIIAAIAVGLFFFSSCLKDNTDDINYEEYLKKNLEFLAENAKREGVITTKSGLQYEVITPGKEDGKTPTIYDLVKCHYKGTLIDGDIFDSSLGGDPIIFPLNKVILGWTEGLQYMKEGAKYRFFIPYNLGYGADRGYGPILPYSTLIFEVELIEVISTI